MFGASISRHCHWLEQLRCGVTRLALRGDELRSHISYNRRLPVLLDADLTDKCTPMAMRVAPELGARGLGTRACFGQFFFTAESIQTVALGHFLQHSFLETVSQLPQTPNCPKLPSFFSFLSLFFHEQ